MTQKKAEILLASVIAARATSLLFSKIAMNGMGIFNLLAARFLMAFVLLAVAQSHTTAQRAGLFCALSPACATLLGAAVLREHISVMGMCGIALILLSLLVPQLWQLAEKKGITLLPRHAVPAVRRA